MIGAVVKVAILIALGNKAVVVLGGLLVVQRFVTAKAVHEVINCLGHSVVSVVG